MKLKLLISAIALLGVMMQASAQRKLPTCNVIFSNGDVVEAKVEHVGPTTETERPILVAESSGWKDFGLRISMNGISSTSAPCLRSSVESAPAWCLARPTSTRIPHRGPLALFAFLLMDGFAGRSARPTRNHFSSFFRPKPCSSMRAAVPETAVSEARLSESIIFCCSSFMRF